MRVVGKRRGLSVGSSTDRGAVMPKMKRLTLDISEDLHRAIKLDAVHAGVTMVERLRALLLKHYGLAAGKQQKTMA